MRIWSVYLKTNLFNISVWTPHLKMTVIRRELTMATRLVAKKVIAARTYPMDMLQGASAR